MKKEEELIYDLIFSDNFEYYIDISENLDANVPHLLTTEKNMF